MFRLKFELAGKNRTAFFGLDIGNSGTFVSDNELQTSDELELCVEHVGLPDVVTLKRVEDDWVKAGIIA